MVVARLPDTTLWLHSPVEFDQELIDQLSSLGDVAHVVSPSHGHTRWASDAKQLFPSATLWGAPDLPAAMPHIPFDRELTAEDVPWSASLGTFLLEGTPKNNEVVFIHQQSRTLICTDLVINVLTEPSWLTRMLYRSIGVWRELGPATVWRKRTKDVERAWRSYERVLDAGFDKVLMAHGDPIEEAGAVRVRAALQWASRGT